MMGKDKTRKFEFVTGYECGLLPVRMTENAAGYDMFCAEDTEVPSLFRQQLKLHEWYLQRPNLMECDSEAEYNDLYKQWGEKCLELRDAIKPVAIPLGIKASFPKDEYLEIVLRSSAPKNFKIVVPNSVGVIDADYYNNDDNEGHIHLLAYSIDVMPVTIYAGERIAQGIFKPYLKTKDDRASGKRMGGFGSTGTI